MARRPVLSCLKKLVSEEEKWWLRNFFAAGGRRCVCLSARISAAWLAAAFFISGGHRICVEVTRWRRGRRERGKEGGGGTLGERTRWEGRLNESEDYRFYQLTRRTATPENVHAWYIFTDDAMMYIN